MEDEYLGTFLVWPVDATTLSLEIEQWQIFVAWNDLYESGASDVNAHPGHGGISKRWDEIEVKLQSTRTEIPAEAKRASVKIEPLEQGCRYAPGGPSYSLCWRVI